MRTSCVSGFGLDLGLAGGALAFDAGVETGGTPRLRLLFVTLAKGIMMERRERICVCEGLRVESEDGGMGRA